MTPNESCKSKKKPKSNLYNFAFHYYDVCPVDIDLCAGDAIK